MEMPLEKMRATARNAEGLLKQLANEHRLLVLCQLADGERSVGELASTTSLAQSALSQHLARLRLHGLVETRRERQSIYYSLKGDTTKRIIGLLYDLYCGPGADGTSAV